MKTFFIALLLGIFIGALSMSYFKSPESFDGILQKGPKNDASSVEEPVKPSVPPEVKTTPEPEQFESPEVPEAPEPVTVPEIVAPADETIEESVEEVIEAAAIASSPEETNIEVPEAEELVEETTSISEEIATEAAGFAEEVVVETEEAIEETVAPAEETNIEVPEVEELAEETTSIAEEIVTEAAGVANEAIAEAEEIVEETEQETPDVQSVPTPEVIEEAVQETEAAIDRREDLKIGTQVTEILNADEEIAALNLKMQVEAGVITLDGKAPSKELADKAIERAKSIEGVKGAINKIQITDTDEQ